METQELTYSMRGDWLSFSKKTLIILLPFSGFKITVKRGSGEKLKTSLKEEEDFFVVIIIRQVPR